MIQRIPLYDILDLSYVLYVPKQLACHWQYIHKSVIFWKLSALDLHLLVPSPYSITNLLVFHPEVLDICIPESCSKLTLRLFLFMLVDCSWLTGAPSETDEYTVLFTCGVQFKACSSSNIYSGWQQMKSH